MFSELEISSASVKRSDVNKMLPHPGEVKCQILDQHQAADSLEEGYPVARNVSMASRPCPNQDNQGCCETHPRCGMHTWGHRMSQEDEGDHSTLVRM